jgi:hypothetical protein
VTAGPPKCPACDGHGTTYAWELKCEQCNGTGVVTLSPRQRWGTCCPFDPRCEHSYMDDRELARWMDSPLTDEQAREIGGVS